MSYIGIDVSKRRLDVAVLEGAGGRFANDGEGIASLVGWVERRGPRLVVMESAGAYHRAVLRALREARVPVALLNPAQVKAFRGVVLGRNKTDREDARLLARFARTYSDQLRVYSPPDGIQRQLREVVGYREGLSKQRTQLLGQLEAARAAGSGWLERRIGSNLAEVEGWIEEASREIERLTGEMPEAGVLLEVKGVGAVVAGAVLAYLPRSVWGNPKAAACYAGVHPSRALLRGVPREPPEPQGVLEATAVPVHGGARGDAVGPGDEGLL